MTAMDGVESEPMNQFQTAANSIAARIGHEPLDLFIVAGSGFRDALPDLSRTIAFPMRDVPGMPAPAVEGHGADLIFGTRDGKRVLIATGRVHMYEGYSPGDVVFATRMVQRLGCAGIILTNAAGSVDHNYPAGTLVAIKDQMNLTGRNCEATTSGVPARFTDMLDAYDPAWLAAVTRETGLAQGVYAGLVGPSYETPAEARMLRVLGANMVGMSTVQECIAARTLGMKVFGLSLITNMAGGMGGPVDHKEVLAAGKDRKDQITAILETVIRTSR